MKSEPARIIGLVMGVATAIVTLIVSLGVVDLTTEQQAAIFAVIAAAGSLATGLWIREKVYAPDTVADIRLTSHSAGYTEGVEVERAAQVRPLHPLVAEDLLNRPR